MCKRQEDTTPAFDGALEKSVKIVNPLAEFTAITVADSQEPEMNIHTTDG